MEKEQAIQVLDQFRNGTHPIQTEARAKMAAKYPTDILIRMCLDPVTYEFKKEWANTAFSEELRKRFADMTPDKKAEEVRSAFSKTIENTAKEFKTEAYYPEDIRKT